MERSPNNNLQEARGSSVKDEIARTEVEIAHAIAEQGEGFSPSHRLGALLGEMDQRSKLADLKGEPVMRVGEARRVMVPREVTITDIRADMVRVGAARQVIAPHELRAMSTEAVQAEQRALHVTLAPMLTRYVDAADGAPKMAALTAMGADLPRYHALGNELADRTSAQLRAARIEKTLAPREAQFGMAF